jgi:hypothetical protein
MAHLKRAMSFSSTKMQNVKDFKPKSVIVLLFWEGVCNVVETGYPQITLKTVSSL